MSDLLFGMYHDMRARLDAIEAHLNRSNPDWNEGAAQPMVERTATMNPDFVGMPPAPPAEDDTDGQGFMPPAA